MRGQALARAAALAALPPWAKAWRERVQAPSGGKQNTLAHLQTPRWVSMGRQVGCANLEQVQSRSGDFELTMDELRTTAGYALTCADPALILFQRDRPEDPRPAAALDAGRVFAEGRPGRAFNRLPQPTPTAPPGPLRLRPPDPRRAVQEMLLRQTASDRRRVGPAPARGRQPA